VVGLTALNWGGGRSLSYEVCVVPEGIRLVSAKAPTRWVGAGCVEGASGVVAARTNTGFDVPSYLACSRKLEGTDTNDASQDPRAPRNVLVHAASDIRFGRLLQMQVALSALGLYVTLGAPCDI
jgi:hypothetical protein